MNTEKLMVLIMLSGLVITFTGPVILFLNPNTTNYLIKDAIICLPLFGSFQILFGCSVPFWHKQPNYTGVKQ